MDRTTTFPINKLWRIKVLPINDVFWILFGLLMFIPIEVGTEGLFLAYFQIIFLFILSKKVSKISILFYFLFSSLVVTSTMMGNDIRLTSLINPLVIGLALMINIKDKHRATMIKNGLYLSGIAHTFYLMYLIVNTKIVTLYLLLVVSRDWAIDYIPYFGNGLGMAFTLLILFAAKEGKITLALLFFIGGTLTTSRVPILAMAMISILYIFRNINIKYISAIAIAGLITTLISFSPTFYKDIVPDKDVDGIVLRLITTDDRLNVYELALSKIYESPFLGAGSEKLEQYYHAHNSYLETTYRYGVFALICWLVLIYLAYFKKLIFSKHIEFILIFALISFAQIGLHNPVSLLILTVYCLLFSENNMGKSKKYLN